MEETLLKVFGILLAVIIFFLLPLYIAFEKKDDISYSLALKITSSFVEDVKAKGYVSNDMYQKFVSDLGVSGNMYDIKLEHTAKKYYPVIYAYNDDYSEIIETFDYNLYKDDFVDGVIESGGRTYDRVILAYDLIETRFTQNQILEALDVTDAEHSNLINNYTSVAMQNIGVPSGMYQSTDGDAIYPMSKGDEFTVIIKNTNTTTATILFNTLTLGSNTGNNTKVYINYGGSIQNEEYRKTTLD